MWRFVVTTPADTKRVRSLGKYELIAKIGEGGMATVYLARLVGPLGFQKILVVKTIHPTLAQSAEFVNMLLDEARIAAMIKHANVVDIYDLGEVDGQYFIAMEYIPGRALSRILGRAKKMNSYIDVYTVAYIIAEAADALDAAHNLHSLSGQHMHLVHRDVSPANIMIAYDGGVKLVDFGVAKSLGRITTTSAGSLKGKVGYLSPEQIMETGVDARSDIFSLGIVLWESLTVGRLFHGDSMGATVQKVLNERPRPPSEFRTGVPEHLDQICMRALALDPDDRFRTAAEMRDELLLVLRSSEFYTGRRVVASYLEEHFANEIVKDQQLLSTVEFAEVLVEAEAPGTSELSGALSMASRREGGVLPADDYVPPNRLSVSGVIERKATDFSNLIKQKRHWGGAIFGAAAVAVGVVIGSWVMGRQGDSKSTPAPVVTVVATSDAAVQVVPPQVDAAAVAKQPADASVAVVDVTVDAGVVAVAKPPKKNVRAERLAKAKASYKKGARLLAQKRLVPAKAAFQAALKARPGYAPAMRGMGIVFQRIGVKSQAIKYFRRYLRASPRAKDKAAIKKRIKAMGG